MKHRSHCRINSMHATCKHWDSTILFDIRLDYNYLQYLILLKSDWRKHASMWIFLPRWADVEFLSRCQMGVVCAIRMQENLRLRLFSNHEDEWSQLCQSGEWLLMAPLQWISELERAAIVSITFHDSVDKNSNVLWKTHTHTHTHTQTQTHTSKKEHFS